MISLKNALPLLALTAAISAPACAESIWSDPLRTANNLSGTPAATLTSSCGFDAQLPVPLTLLDAVERALCRNPQTRQAWANVKVQTAALGVSRAAYLPTLTAAGSWSKADNRYSYPDFPENNSSLKTHSSNANLSLNWVLYDSGLRAANLENARQLLNAASAAQDDVLQTVFLNTVQSFYQAQAAQAMLSATADAELAAQQSFKASEARYQAGAGALADKLQAQTSYAQASLKRAQAAGDLQSALGTLAIVMGLRPNIPVALADLGLQATDAPLLQQAADDLIADAVRSHPKILAAQAQLKSAQAQVDAARAEGRPTLSLFATGDRNDTPINQVSSKQTITSRSIGLQVSIPLFDGFGRKYKVRGAQAQAESRQADLENIEQQVMLEVWKSDQALRTEAENLNTTDILLRSAKQSFDVAQGRYKAGVGNILELLKAQSDLASAQQQRILALTSWQTARLRLAASLGRLRMDGI
ncbi:TolC family protein [Collimonas fungivorans]|uniref:TolC family protein n=1 Tax=Collimonas fungivorans TaxID=158899 RepID=UPI003FA3CFB2